MEPMTMAIIGGTVLSSFGTYSASRARSSLMRDQAFQLGLSAEEIINRNAENVLMTRKEAEGFIGNQIATIAGAGADVGSGVSLSLMEETARLSSEEIIKMTREAEFEAESRRLEADNMRSNARSISRGGMLGAVGGLIGGLGNAFG